MVTCSLLMMRTSRSAQTQGLDNPFQAARYHSLVIDKESCPPELEVTAWTEDGTIMAVRHRDYPHVQVHAQALHLINHGAPKIMMVAVPEGP